MDESGPSYQSMDPTSLEDAGASGSAAEGEGLQRQISHPGSVKSEEGGQRKMSPIATVIGYVTKQCYIAALILMMVGMKWFEARGGSTEWQKGGHMIMKNGVSHIRFWGKFHYS